MVRDNSKELKLKIRHLESFLKLRPVYAVRKIGIVRRVDKLF